MPRHIAAGIHHQRYYPAFRRSDWIHAELYAGVSTVGRMKEEIGPLQLDRRYAVQQGQRSGDGKGDFKAPDRLYPFHHKIYRCCFCCCLLRNGIYLRCGIGQGLVQTQEDLKKNLPVNVRTLKKEI